jgi:hypothetical protein
MKENCIQVTVVQYGRRINGDKVAQKLYTSSNTDPCVKFCKKYLESTENWTLDIDLLSRIDKSHSLSDLLGNKFQKHGNSMDVENGIADDHEYLEPFLFLLIYRCP